MAAEVNYNGNSTVSEAQTTGYKHWHRKDGPHEEFFGNLSGATIWNIIREALFPTAWWAILIGAILGIGTLVAFIKMISDYKRLINYEYKIKRDDIVGGIIGLIIVNLIANLLFHGAWAWIGQIMIASVSIGFTKTIFEIIMKEVSKTQVKPEPQTNEIQLAQIEQPMIQPIQTNLTCPNCGFERSEQSKFCIGCGYKF